MTFLTYTNRPVRNSPTVSVRPRSIAFNAALMRQLSEGDVRCTVLVDNDRRRVAFKFGDFPDGFKLTKDGPSSIGTAIACAGLRADVAWLETGRHAAAYDEAVKAWIIEVPAG